MISSDDAQFDDFMVEYYFTYDERGVFRVKKGDYVGAIQDFQEIRLRGADHDDYGGLLYRTANAWEKLGDKGKAEAIRKEMAEWEKNRENQ